MPLGSLDRLTNARVFYTTSLGIKKLHPKVFAKMQNLAVLDLVSLNNLTELVADTFYGLGAVTSLSLAECARLETMESGAMNSAPVDEGGRHISRGTGLVALGSLVLQNNPKLQFPASDPGFDYLPSLKTIHVANCNSVTTLSPGLFARLPVLENVSFELNHNLATIAKDAFRGGGSIRRLVLLRNPRLAFLVPGCFEGMVHNADLRSLSLR